MLFFLSTLSVSVLAYTQLVMQLELSLSFSRLLRRSLLLMRCRSTHRERRKEGRRSVCFCALTIVYYWMDGRWIIFCARTNTPSFHLLLPPGMLHAAAVACHLLMPFAAAANCFPCEMEKKVLHLLLLRAHAVFRKDGLSR
jgi:hypothetical protein